MYHYKLLSLGAGVSILMAILSVNVAEGRSIEEMAMVANDYVKHSASIKREISGKSPGKYVSINPIPLYTSEAVTGEGEPALAVFGMESWGGGKTGFIMVASDERYGDIMGYSTGGSFNIDSIPDGLKWMIQQFELSSTHANYSTTSVSFQESNRQSAAMTDDYPSIAPLITSTWDQDAPYDRFTPVEDGQHCVTGCVATSMAQLIRYFSPQTFTSGAGEIEDEAYHSASFDFSGLPFAWELMRDDYSSGNYSDEEADEVARLMLACGVSVNMMYGLKESGAYTSLYMPYAFTEYFSMSNDVFVAFRDDYSAKEWRNLIYNELSQGRPVNYSGNSSLGGHSFICDGYDKDGLFHFNWGWSGVSDGYYNLNMLNPLEQGIGGSGGFNESQEIIGGLKVAEEKSIAFPTFLNDAKFDAVQSSDYADTFRLQGYIYYMWPDSNNIEFGIGIKEVASDSPVTYISSRSSFTFDKTDLRKGLQYLENGEFKVVMPSGLNQDAVYNVFPCYRVVSSEEWRQLPLKESGNRSLTLRVDEKGKREYTPGRISEHPEYLDPGSEFSVGDMSFRILEGLTADVELTDLRVQNGLNPSPEIEIPNEVVYSDIKFKVKEISPDKSIFEECRNVTKIVFPNDMVQHLDESPDWFGDLRNLRQLNIPAGLTGLHAFEFKKCPRLQTIEIALGHPELEKSEGCVYFLTPQGNVLEYVDNKVENCIVKPGTYKIGAEAASGSNMLKTLQADDYLIEIGEYSFMDCSELYKVEIGDGLQSIGKGAFAGCRNLHSLNLGKSLSSIEVTAFEECADINEIRISRQTPPEINRNGNPVSDAECKDLFSESVYARCNLIVPERVISEYRRRSPWNYFKMIKPQASGILNCNMTEGIKLRLEDRAVVIVVSEDLPYPLPVSLYSVEGREITSDVVRSGDEKRIEMPHPGVYFIRLNDNSFKIIR